MNPSTSLAVALSDLEVADREIGRMSVAVIRSSTEVGGGVVAEVDGRTSTQMKVNAATTIAEATHAALRMPQLVSRLSARQSHTAVPVLD